MFFLKKIFIFTLIFTLATNPLYSWDKGAEEKKLRDIYQSISELNYKTILQRGLSEAKEKKHRDQILKALSVVEKRPELGQIKAVESINNMSYFFLNNLEKDFIAFPNTYNFYKGFRSIFRGYSLGEYTNRCTYRRDNAIPFNLIDFLNGKINCGRPINYPKRAGTNDVAREIEKNLVNFEMITETKGSFEMGKKFAQGLKDFFLPDAYAISKKASKALYISSFVALALGAALILVGLAATPVAGIGIPVIAGGVLLVAGGLATSSGVGIKNRIDRRRMERERSP